MEIVTIPQKPEGLPRIKEKENECDINKHNSEIYYDFVNVLTFIFFQLTQSY